MRPLSLTLLPMIVWGTSVGQGGGGGGLGLPPKMQCS